MTEIRIREMDESDRPWVERLLKKEWGGVTVVSRGQIHEPTILPGFVALDGERPVGMATYHIECDSCELVTLNSLEQGKGIGMRLVLRVKEAAFSAGCRRLWLITTNDNTPALRFYQRRGFQLVAIHRDALEESRMLKPGIPEIGLDGIPIRDELELEMTLKGGS